MARTPVVYFIHGEDEVGIDSFVASLKQRMGDATAVVMNTNRFVDRFDMGELKNLASAVPFLASRRLVVLDNVLGQLKGKQDREDFFSFLDKVPESTALVIIERSEVKAGQWFLKWAQENTERAFIKPYPLLKGGALARWVQDYAREAGGEVLPQAAQHLVTLIGDDIRTAGSEVDKLLAYVNYARPVEIDDVELLTAPVIQANIFAMVDALGARNGTLALTLLHELMTEREDMLLFGMILRQFRLLLQYKDLHAHNQPSASIARELGVQDFVVSKLSAQARNFDMQTLESVYRQLTFIDESVKSGRINMDIALDTFVAAVTTR